MSSACGFPPSGSQVGRLRAVAPSTPWSVRYPRTVRRIQPRWGLFKRRLPRQIASRQTSGVVKKGVTSDTYTMDLQPREFTLLQELMLNAGRVLSREKLEERMSRWGEEVESNAVAVHVHHLRRELGANIVKTIRGVGYGMPRGKHA